MVIHGGMDRMITFPHAEVLLKGLGGKESGITVHFEPGRGHVLPMEMRKEFNRWVEELIAKSEGLK
jgi:predicted esterase